MDNQVLLIRAQSYALKGWKIFPCRPKDEGDKKVKAPWIANPFGKASSDTKQIKEWWTQWPGSMIGWYIGNEYAVIDLDRHPGGKDGIASFLTYLDECGQDFPKTYEVNTAGGGKHLYFRLPQGITLHSRINILDGVDLKTGEGYVILPPSENKNTGTCYEVVNKDTDIIEMPSFLIELCQKKEAKNTAVPSTEVVASTPSGDNNDALKVKAEMLSKLRSCTQGSRNDLLNRTAVVLFGFAKSNSLDATKVEEDLLDACYNNGLISDDGRESVMKTINSAFKAAKPLAPFEHKDTEISDEPIPLGVDYIPYPIEIFKKYGKFLTEYSRAKKVPIELCGQELLFAFALAGQRLYNVKTKEYGSTPLSIFNITLAESGEGKGVVDDFFMAPFEEKLVDLINRYEEKKINCQSINNYFELQEKDLKSHRTKLKKDEFIKKLNEIKKEQSNNKEPFPPLLFIDNVNREGLYKNLLQQSSLGIKAEEGLLFFGNDSYSEEKKQEMSATLTSLYSGKAIGKSRLVEETSRIENRRLSMNVLIQPGPARKIFKDLFFMEQGFFPRCLIVNCPSIPKIDIEEFSKSSPLYVEYANSIKNLLDIPMETNNRGALILQDMPLSEGAQTKYHDYLNYIGTCLADDTYEDKYHPEYKEIRPAVLRAAENALRVSAILALMDNQKNPVVSDENMENGIQYMTYCLENFYRTFKVDKVFFDAQKLLNWWHTKDISVSCYQHIQNRGPNAFRKPESKPYVEKLIGILERYGWIVRINGTAPVVYSEGNIKHHTNCFLVR